MSKEKLTFEQAQENRNAIKADLKAARNDFNAFRKENKIKRDEPPADEKLLKKYNKHQDTINALEEKLAKAETSVKELKPAKTRETKYEYPLVKDEKSGEEREMTKAEKKKYRAKARNAKRKVEKGETEPKNTEKETPAPEKKKKKKESKEEED